MIAAIRPPTDLAALRHDLLDSSKSLDEIAALHSTTVDQLSLWLTSDEGIQTLTPAADSLSLRIRLAAASHIPDALTIVSAAMKAYARDAEIGPPESTRREVNPPLARELSIAVDRNADFIHRSREGARRSAALIIRLATFTLGLSPARRPAADPSRPPPSPRPETRPAHYPDTCNRAASPLPPASLHAGVSTHAQPRPAAGSATISPANTTASSGRTSSHEASGSVQDLQSPDPATQPTGVGGSASEPSSVQATLPLRAATSVLVPATTTMIPTHLSLSALAGQTTKPPRSAATLQAHSGQARAP